MQNSSFRTEIIIPEYKNKIEVDSKITFIGSCFATNIGNLASKNRLHTNINPHGVLYNPISISNSLKDIIDNKKIESDSLVFNNEVWQSFQHHGKFSGAEKLEVISQINYETEAAHNFLKDSHFLIITFGTSYVYKHKELNRVVANCHKFPASNFERYRIGVDDIVEEYLELLERLNFFNPNINVILSVSPIRHTKDTLQGNQLSKSILLLAVEEIIKDKFNTSYFPSYEIMMDDLRDYRFYDDSMIQPSETAKKYIWNKFINSYFSESSVKYLREINKIIKAINHKPHNTKSNSYHKFLLNTEKLIRRVQLEYRGANLESDLEIVLKGLNSGM